MTTTGIMQEGSFPEGKIALYILDRSRFGELLGRLGIESIEKDENGAPYLKDSPYKISLSHKGDLQVLVLSRGKVGVDIEEVTVPRNVERLSRLFHEKEKPTSLYDFYKVWTSKEAVGKLLGTGVTTALLSSYTEGVRHIDHGDYLIAVAGDGDIIVNEEK